MLETDDLIWVSQGENTGYAVLKDIFGTQVLAAMGGKDDERVLVHRDNVKKILPVPGIH